MSGKLDQSLDDILKSRRTPRGVHPRGGKSTRTTRVTSKTPSGGVKKTTTKTTTTTNGKVTKPVVPMPASGDSKILVSGLPPDVTEQQIKDYFTKTIGPVKKVFLTYGPSGQSRGISTIVFIKPGSAHDAATQLNGVKVDNRAMKIEVILGANQAPVPVPAKALGERIAKKTATAPGKNQPKSAVGTTTKKSARDADKGGRRGGRTARPKRKTAAELDAEMTDYFDGNAANGTATANGTAAPAVAAAGGDAGMEDEIM